MRCFAKLKGDRTHGESSSTVKVSDAFVDSKTQVGSADERH